MKNLDNLLEYEKLRREIIYSIDGYVILINKLFI
jgi:hypothetical protein